MNRLLTVLALTVVGTACDVDFTEPVPSRPHPGPSPASLAGSAHMDTRPGGGFRFFGHLAPGITDHGAVRPVPDDTLRVGTFPLAPDHVDPWGRRSYRWLPEPGLSPGPLRLQAPSVEGLQEVPPTVSFRTYRRVGPDTLFVALDDTLGLEIAPVDGSADPPTSVAWNLSLASAGGLSISRYQESAPPSIIRVPGAWLEWAGGEPLRAQLSVRETWVHDPVGALYRLHLDATSVMEWAIHWAGSDPGTESGSSH